MIYTPLILSSAVEQFIRAKYERKLYIEKGEGGSNSSKGKELSVQEQKNKAKQKKTLSTSSTQKSAQVCMYYS